MDTTQCLLRLGEQNVCAKYYTFNFTPLFSGGPGVVAKALRYSR